MTGIIKEFKDVLGDEIIKLETIFFVTITIDSGFIFNGTDLLLKITIDNGYCKITKELVFYNFNMIKLVTAIKDWIIAEINVIPKSLCVEVKW